DLLITLCKGSPDTVHTEGRPYKSRLHMELDPGIIYAFASDLLKEDLGRGDITTQSVVRGGAKGRGRFLAKQDFILCGLEVGEAVFSTLDNTVTLESRVYDGEAIAAGAEFARIEGPAAVLLTGERTALNIMQRLSAVATLTKALVDRLEGTGARIVDTRKTTPGLRLLEKYAVTVGGGHNHRFGLGDGVLIKDNHIAIAGGITMAVNLARQAVSHLQKIEVEVEHIPTLYKALAAGAEAILLVNKTPEHTCEAVCLVLVTSGGQHLLLESSGVLALQM